MVESQWRQCQRGVGEAAEKVVKVLLMDHVYCELWAKTRLPGGLVYDGRRRRRRRSSFDMGSVEFWRCSLCFPSCILDQMEAQRGVYQMVNDD